MRLRSGKQQKDQIEKIGSGNELTLPPTPQPKPTQVTPNKQEKFNELYG